MCERQRQNLKLYWQPSCESVAHSVVALIPVRFPRLRPCLCGSIEPPSYCCDESRDQYDAKALLSCLPRKELSLWVIHEDLYSPGYQYLFGVASGRNCVVSCARLEEPRHILKEVCHEIGHLYGLSHCPYHCVMRASRSMASLLKKTDDFCHRCKGKLYNWI